MTSPALTTPSVLATMEPMDPPMIPSGMVFPSHPGATPLIAEHSFGRLLAYAPGVSDILPTTNAPILTPIGAASFPATLRLVFPAFETLLDATHQLGTHLGTVTTRALSPILAWT